MNLNPRNPEDPDNSDGATMWREGYKIYLDNNRLEMRCDYSAWIVLVDPHTDSRSRGVSKSLRIQNKPGRRSADSKSVLDNTTSPEFDVESESYQFDSR